MWVMMGGLGSLSHGFIMAWDDVDEDFHFRLQQKILGYLFLGFLNCPVHIIIMARHHSKDVCSHIVLELLRWGLLCQI